MSWKTVHPSAIRHPVTSAQSGFRTLLSGAVTAAAPAAESEVAPDADGAEVIEDDAAGDTEVAAAAPVHAEGGEEEEETVDPPVDPSSARSAEDVE